MKKGILSGKTAQVLMKLLITAVVGFLYFYISLPALNPQSQDFYTFLGFIVVVYIVLTVISLKLHKDVTTGREAVARLRKHCLAPVIIIAVLIAVYIIGSIVGAPIFRARAYRELLTVDRGDFATDVAEASFDRIPMLDEESAIRLGNRQMGELADLVSQFEVPNRYTQINFRGRPVRVTYLNYGDFFKWWNNRREGLPAYITIDMVTQEANVVRLSDLGLEGMKYSPSEWFNRKLERHLRFSYPTFMFSEPTFEIDEDGHPWWVSPRIIKKIGLFGGVDIHGAVLTNAITGESTYYVDPPTWVDRVYLASLISQQYDFHGRYVNGFINSIIGQRDVTVTTAGYNYIAMYDDVYMYTGITSVGTDQSNIGFLLSNQRTKQTTFYPVPGAIEQSARASAEGVVQHLRYNTTFPLLLNIAGEPTYFMALKDEANLVKLFAMVNVTQYQVVAIGETVEECERNYLQLILDRGIAEIAYVPQTDVVGVISDIRSAVLDGNTHFYIRLGEEDYYYVFSLADVELAAILNVGDSVVISRPDGAGELRRASMIERVE